MEKIKSRQPLLVGFGRVDITPDYDIGLGGYGGADKRRVKEILDRLYMTCIALTQGEETLLLYTLDAIGCGEKLSNEIREVAVPALGISEDRIIFGATHSHSCPIIRFPDAASERYREFLPHAAVDAARIALADQVPASVLQAKQAQNDMAFVRHYKLADGTYMGSNFNEDSTVPIVAHAAEAQCELGVVKFVREGKQDILLVNWHTHPDHASKNGFRNISADFPGALRAKIESETDLLVAYFTGSSGNQGPSSRIAEETPGLTMPQYGQEMANRVLALLPELTALEGPALAVKQITLEADINHSWDHRMPEVEQIVHVWQTENRDKATELAIRYGFTSAYHAKAVKNRVNLPKSETMHLRVFSVGGVGFVSVPNEMFGVTGADIKARSPFENTVIIAGNETYIPHKDAFRYNCYEACTTPWAEGTAERIADTLVTMLHEINQGG